MTSRSHDLSVVVDGQSLPLDPMHPDPLVRAVLISLFTWRRALPDDVLPGSARMGWWGDGTATVRNDRIGSRLWLLAREKLTPQTMVRARQYGEEALAWLVEDGVAARVEVQAERQGLSTLVLTSLIHERDGRLRSFRFPDLWKVIHG